MDNTGRTFTIDNTGTWNLTGTISGGVINTPADAALNIAEPVYSKGPATLDGTTLSGAIHIPAGTILNMTNGLTLDGAVVEVAEGQISASGTQNLDGTGVIRFDAKDPPTNLFAEPAWAPGGYLASGENSTLTVGPGITIETGSGSGNIGYYASGAAIINQGLISANTPGQSITITGPFTNQGTIEADNSSGVIVGTGYTSKGFVNDGGDIRIAAGATLSSHYPLTFNGGAVGGDGTIIAAGGASVIGTVVKSGTGIFDVGGSGLAVASGAQLDLTVGKLIARAPSAQLGTWNGSTYTALTGLIQSGRNGGTWDGPGIMTSDSNGGDHNEIGIATASQALGISATQTGTWMSQSVNGSDVLVMYTYGGDANLDGKLNIDDYGRIDASVGQSGSVFGWYNGDFNYDGKINIDDYGIIDSNIGSQGPPLGIAPASLAGIAQADGITAVPEPASILLLLLPLLAQPARRRRCKI
jgi:hypothetical protein